MKTIVRSFVQGQVQDDGTIEVICQGRTIFSGDKAAALVLLGQMDPLMKQRGNFLYATNGVTLRSYDVKDTIRVLREVVK